MYYMITYSCIISMWTIICVAHPQKLTSVLNEAVAKKLYTRIRTQYADAEPPSSSNLSPDTKNRICHYMTGNSFFKEVLKEDRLYIHDLYEQLMKKDPSLLLTLYELPSNKKSSGMQLVYTNSTKQVHSYITYEEGLPPSIEYVFKCMTIPAKEDEDMVYVYYISEEYNLNDTPFPHIAGRFIFTHFDPEDTAEVELFAIAEEAAEVVSSDSPSAEHRYLQNRAKHEPALVAQDDPICKLTQNERLRVCSLVLNSLHFAGKFKFIPDYKYVDAVICVKNQISFRDGLAKSRAIKGKRYEEWMISCRTRQYFADYQFEYFLSRVYDSDNQVFVFRWTHDKKIVIENLFGKIRFKIT